MRVQPLADGLRFYHGAVLLIEPAGYQQCPGLHAAGVGGEVLEDDVAVDIGQDQVIFACLDEGGIAAEGVDAVGDAVAAGIFPGGTDGHRVDVYGMDGDRRLHLCREDGEDAGAAAHVEDLQAADGLLVGEHCLDDQSGGLVMSGAEGHLGVDDYRVFGPGQTLVERGLYGAAAVDDHGLEGGLPESVPVLLGNQG